MRYDPRRGAYILQQRNFWTGLLLLLCLIAVGLELSFRVPHAVGAARIGLVLAIGALAYLVLKINFTILLSIQVELYPETRKLLLKSLFNQQDVADSVRSVEISYPDGGGPAGLAIVAEQERYELYRWAPDEEANRIYQCYGRQIARCLRLPLKEIQAGESRRVTQPSALRFVPFLDRTDAERRLFRAPRERLIERCAGLARIDAPPDLPRLQVRWVPARRVSRLLWAICGGLFCLAVLLALRGGLPQLLAPPGYATLIGMVLGWIYWGSYIYFAPVELALDGGDLRYQVASAQARWCYWPFIDRPVREPAGELADAWVAGEPPVQRLYLEFRRELVSIETDPLGATDLAGLLFHQLLAGRPNSL